MLKVYNTLSRQKEDFIPLNPPFVGMYVCGPTVYDDPHLGHAKSYISFDVIVRFLRSSGYKVRYIQNITDVGHLLGDAQDGEDRILQRARLEQLEPIEIAQKYENHYFRDMDRLNCQRPDISCRASGFIPEMIELVSLLIDKGFGYEVDGDVYFDVSKFEGYGKLSNRRVEDLKEGVRVDVAEGKRHPADFALWKKADPQHLMQWDSPWSRGFPGWHLECSVMSMKFIGETIDIHGGGLDNQFPHHECEIAQSEAATGKPFVRYWLHNNMVTVDGQKMSKSLGNFVTLDDLFQKYNPMTIRFFILQGHYRSPQDFSDQALDAAKKGFERLTGTVVLLEKQIETAQDIQSADTWDLSSFERKLKENMEDDFNTSGAISVLFDLVKKVNASGWLHPETHPPKHELEKVLTFFRHHGEDILGLQFASLAEKKTGPALEDRLIDYLILLRQMFRENKDWASADAIRDKLADLGIVLEDGKGGTGWK